MMLTSKLTTMSHFGINFGGWYIKLPYVVVAWKLCLGLSRCSFVFLKMFVTCIS